MKRTLFFAGVVLVLFGACAGALGYFFLQASEEVDDAEAVLGEFLRHTSNGNYDSAYALLARELKSELTLAKFKTDLASTNSFSGYASLKRTGWHLKAVAGQDTRMDYSGRVRYIPGGEGTLEALLLKQGGSWRIRAVNVKRDPRGVSGQ